MALDLRLLYCLAEVFFSYFRVRKLLWPGEKEAIRYLTAHDPAYLDLFKQYLAETDRERKVQLYEQLAALTTAPVGGLWEDGTTAVQFKPETELQPGMIEEGFGLLGKFDHGPGSRCVKMDKTTVG